MTQRCTELSCEGRGMNAVMLGMKELFSTIVVLLFLLLLLLLLRDQSRLSVADVGAWRCGEYSQSLPNHRQRLQ